MLIAFLVPGSVFASDGTQYESGWQWMGTESNYWVGGTYYWTDHIYYAEDGSNFKIEVYASKKTNSLTCEMYVDGRYRTIYGTGISVLMVEEE